MATSYYEQQLEVGQRYQDFIAAKLSQKGISLVNFQSQRYQRTHGENTLGLEIKFDDKLASTRNLWIEVAEKRTPDQPSWVDSGIMRADNSWLYGIGNYQEFFLFSKRTLREYSRSARIHVNLRQTSRGFLLPHSEAMSLKERRFQFVQDEASGIERRQGRNQSNQPNGHLRPDGSLDPDFYRPDNWR